MPLTADAIAAHQVQDHLKSLYHLVHEIEKKRQQSEQGVNNLIKHQSSQDEKASQHYQMKMKSLLKTAASQSEMEEDLLRKALQRIHEIRNIKNERRIQARHAGNKESIRGTWMKMLVSSGQTLPMFVGKMDEKPPPLCGAIPADPGYVAKVGDKVAALVKLPEGGEVWICADVVSYNHSTNKYEIDDVDENQKGRHTLSKRLVVPLPLMRTNPETDPGALFPQHTVVMALYPTTSCFYKGVVSEPPATHAEGYQILFEDSTCTGGYSPPYSVAQRFVFAIKQKTKAT